MNTTQNDYYLNTYQNPEHQLLDPAERQLIETLSSNIIMHPGLQKARDVLRHVVAENQCLSEPRHAILIGDSGCGKTTLLDLITEERPAKEQCFRLGIRMQQPVLILSLPSTITPRSMAVQVLRSMGDQSAHNGTCQELTELLIHHIKQCNVQVIFVDEFQHLLALGRGTERGANQRLLAARNWIKSVIVATHVTFVLMGMPDTLALIDQEAQMERRFTHLLHLSPFEPPSASENQMVDFADQLLDTAVEELGLFTHADKFRSSSEDALRLYAATHGVPSAIKDLVIRAALCAYRRKSRAMSMGDFANAFIQLRQARLDVESVRTKREKRRSLAQAVEGRVLNPFTAKIEELKPIIAQMAP